MRYLLAFLIFFVGIIPFSYAADISERGTIYQSIFDPFGQKLDEYNQIYANKVNRKILIENKIYYSVRLKQLSMNYDEIDSLSDLDFQSRIAKQKERLIALESTLKRIAMIRNEFYLNSEAILPISILSYVQSEDEKYPGDIILLYQNKLYFTYIQKAEEYLKNNTLNIDILQNLYRTYFIIGDYEKSLTNIALLHKNFPEEFNSSSIYACDAVVIATYAKNIKMRIFYNKICSKVKNVY